MNTPIALSCGDASGIGIEIALKAWQKIAPDCQFFIIGDYDFICSEAEKQNQKPIRIKHPHEVKVVFDKGLPVIHIDFPVWPQFGKSQAENAAATLLSINLAVKFVKIAQAAALCTLPISKSLLQNSTNFSYPGHTEYLAYLSHVDKSYMMLTTPNLRVVPVTIHIPLCHVASNLTQSLLENTIKVTHKALQQDFSIKNPRLCVAGLNPHAGEHGTIGTEEIDVILPVLNRLGNQTYQLMGPIPADVMFYQNMRKKYDAAICMYHDQALIPLKTLDFFSGVNITLGLPFIRTSPDHGSAYDIAGKGIANPNSLIEALVTARILAQNRTHNQS